ncbi:hypothetical protein RI129_000731 [Pyrocoelia pectoralis]|uniref:Putative nuclease HARBI1 n=1 Tax=Pyrocoelia pectoralis TaxID=417401 RepID=A0AAN7ZP49_9COLE
MDYADYVDYLVNAPIARTVRDRRDPIDIYSDSEFRERFGFTKDSVLSLLEMIGPYLEHATDRNFALSPRLQLLCSLRIFRTGIYQLVAGDLINVHRTTAGRAFDAVINGLLALAPLYIAMPNTRQQCNAKKRAFYRLGGFPNVIGAIDGSHFRILCPPGNHNELFRNRKGFFSINAQIICDADMIITNVVSRWPGSTHDARIWDNSTVAARFEAGEYGGLLVGDSGYALSPSLMTPLLQPRTQGERRYNRAHILTRNIVERTFGVLKKRFQILQKEMRFHPTKCGNIIVASCVLHNFGIDVGDVYQVDEVIAENAPYHVEVVEERGNLVRRALILNYFSH